MLKFKFSPRDKNSKRLEFIEFFWRPIIIHAMFAEHHAQYVKLLHAVLDITFNHLPHFFFMLAPPRGASFILFIFLGSHMVHFFTEYFWLIE